MAICPAGHITAQTDFCDTCGLPVPGAGETPAASAAPPPAGLTCPHCSAANVPGALFCETCGYDFTTGALPAPAEAAAPPAAEAAPAATPALPPPPPPAPAIAPAPPVEAAPAIVEPTPVAVPSPPETPMPPVEWIAELWIDPDWYALQGSTDPLPSPGLPDIVPLVKDTLLIGRVSVSRGIYPDIDCELDTGCSRRHARLTTDGLRWWIEDLDSANGTFVGAAAGPLPAMPIPRGRVELAPDQRIYVGAWTRIVIRRATEDEREAFAG